MSENNPFPGENNTGHYWDGNLRELTNEPPRWWMIFFWVSIAAWIIYGILYPMWPTGVGEKGYTQGVLGWTSIKEYKEGLEQVEKVRAPYEEKLKGKSAAEILADKELTDYTLRSAKVLFGDNCAACHGNGGQGNPGFPVLADDDWLFGGSIEKIEESITGGRQSIMPAMGGMQLTDSEVNELASAIAKGEPTSTELFTAKGCIACHGPDGKGLEVLGSANLTDAIWRFAPGGVESARHTILHGVNDPSKPETREAVMPAFRDRLDATTIKKLAVYVYKFGGGK